MPWQPSSLMFPDIEMLVADRLRPLVRTALSLTDADLFVGNSVPNPRFRHMVVATRDGGNVVDVTDRPRVRVRVWGKRATEASDLARLVVALMPTLVDGDPVVLVRHLSGPIEVPDVQEQRYLLFEIHTQGVQL